MECGGAAPGSRHWDETCEHSLLMLSVGMLIPGVSSVTFILNPSHKDGEPWSVTVRGHIKIEIYRGYKGEVMAPISSYCFDLSIKVILDYDG